MPRQVEPMPWIKKSIKIKTMEGEFTIKKWEPDNEDAMNLEDQFTGPLFHIDLSDPNQLAALKSDGTTPEDKQFTRCSYPNCEKVFRNSSSMRRHLLIHGPRAYQCFECGKSFLENSKLKRHQLVHNGERPYQCSVCAKCFSLSYNLKTHFRIHTGEKPYVCSWGCGKKFAQLPNLYSHLLVHEKKLMKSMKSEK